MVFSGAVFLYAFLPLTLAVYALAPQRGRNAVLLIASLLFYAFGARARRSSPWGHCPPAASGLP